MKVKLHSDGSFTYRCPCGDVHHITPKIWTWNGNVESPTISPSVLVRSGHYVPRQPGEPESCWCTYAKEHPEDKLPFGCYLCHSYVENGSVRFLNDCSHEHAGKTLPIPDWEKTP